MKNIKLHGEVGWEIWASNVIAQLDSVNGDDVTIDFSSPGGDVFEGVEIYNAFTDYKRKNPNAKIIFEVKGVAASMGSYLISNPVIDEVKIENNASYMLHNPWLFAAGDFRAMQKKADFLEGLTKMIAPSYSDVSGKSINDIRTMMDDETWLFGQEIVDAGFADSILQVETQEEKAVALSRSKMSFSNMKERFEELENKKDFDSDRAAAILKTDTPGKPDEIKPAPVGKSIQEVPVENKAELKKELPAVYNEVLNDGVMKERESEKERRVTLSAMKAKDEYKNIPEVVAVIDKGIVEGDSIVEVQTMMQATMVTLLNKPGKIDELESPGVIAGGGGEEKPAEKQNAEV